MSSADVSHSFWIPRLAGKTDSIPNRVNTMWINPAEAGLYLGQCAQYCGTQHAKMLLRVYAESPSNFAAWANKQQPASVKDLSDNPLAREGRAVFLRTACVSCHTVAGTSANGRFGPDLTHVASRDTISSGAIENTSQNLRKWIAAPNEMKPGSLMPSMHLNFYRRGSPILENSTRSICSVSVTVATVERTSPPGLCWSTIMAAEMFRAYRR